MLFSDIYTSRPGAAAILPSGCSGFAFTGQPPAVLPTTAFGAGLAYRFVLTPQVWTISGDVSASFDARDTDPFAGMFIDPAPNNLEVNYSKIFGIDPVRLTVSRPTIGLTGFEYARLSSVWAPVLSERRQYHCVIGITTFATDVLVSASGTFSRTLVFATAFVRDGSSSRTFSLARSTVSIASDVPGRRVTISLRLVGTPVGAGGADVDLGTFAATAPIDPATGNFVAPLTSAVRTVTGTISGRFFGPQAVEVGVALGGSVADIPTAPGFTFAGAAFGVR